MILAAYLSWGIMLIFGAAAIAMVVYIRWLRRKLHDLERQSLAYEDQILALSGERVGLRQQIAGLDLRRAQCTQENRNATEALRKAIAEGERLSEALKSLQTKDLDPPLPPKGTGPVRRS